MSTDSIVVLSHPTALATKRFYLGAGGKTLTDPYGEGKYFKAETVPLGGLADLADLLELLSKDTRAFCIRAEVIPGSNLDRLRRTKKTKDGEVPCLREYPRRWMMIDVDGLDHDKHVDWSTPAGCQEAATWLLGKLPMELRTAGHVWQCSSSAGQKPGVRMHFWFAVDRPMGEAELERWGEAVNDTNGKKILDLAVFRTVQPLYIANPVFDHVIDPVAQRLGYVPGAPAVLPRLASRADQWKRKLEPLYYESNDKIHDHVRDACASYFCAHGPDAEVTTFRGAVIDAVARAEELQSRQGDYPEDKIDGEIQSGRDFARGRAAAGDNLLLDGKGMTSGAMANIMAVMQSDEEWRGLLAWNTRSAQIQILRTTPWGSSPGYWNDATDSIKACVWFGQRKRVPVDDSKILRAAIAYARETEVDPIAEWLTNLVWDGERRIDGWLTGWCGAPDSSYTRRVARMWLIGCVARALMPGCKNDTALVLQGPTGLGKSMLFEILAGEGNYAAVTEEKDLLQKIHGPWIVELPELGPFRTMNYNHIKGFTSTRIDRFRAPYMRLPEDRKRTCSLAVTLNPEGIGWNHDATSARRFWPVNVTRIDREAVAAAREQMFAEAVVAFKDGELWWVEDPQDAEFIEPQNSIYAYDTWEDVVTRVLRDGAAGYGPGGREHAIIAGKNEFTLIDMLVAGFADNRAEKRNQERLAKVLTRLGYTNEKHVWRKLLTPTDGLGTSV